MTICVKQTLTAALLILLQGILVGVFILLIKVCVTNLLIPPVEYL